MSRHSNGRDDYRNRDRDEDRDEDGEQEERRSHHRRHRHHRHHSSEPKSFWSPGNPNFGIAVVCLCLALLTAMVGIAYLGGQRYLTSAAMDTQIQEATKDCLKAKRIPVVNYERTMFYCVAEVDSIVVIGGK